jgi:hypothetical protein
MGEKGVAVMIDSGGEDTDGEGTTGIVEEKNRGDSDRPIGPASGGSRNGLSSGLQPGGIKPGGGPGAAVGSIGTGGGSDENETTGDADRNNIDEEQR